MIRFHATAKVLRDGSYRPMVMVRREDGTLVGSRVAQVVAPYETYVTKDAAKAHARLAAHRAVVMCAAQDVYAVVA